MESTEQQEWQTPEVTVFALSDAQSGGPGTGDALIPSLWAS